MWTSTPSPPAGVHTRQDHTGFCKVQHEKRRTYQLFCSPLVLGGQLRQKELAAVHPGLHGADVAAPHPLREAAVGGREVKPGLQLHGFMPLSSDACSLLGCAVLRHHRLSHELEQRSIKRMTCNAELVVAYLGRGITDSAAVAGHTDNNTSRCTSRILQGPQQACRSISGPWTGSLRCAHLIISLAVTRCRIWQPWVLRGLCTDLSLHHVGLFCTCWCDGSCKTRLLVEAQEMRCHASPEP